MEMKMKEEEDKNEMKTGKKKNTNKLITDSENIEKASKKIKEKPSKEIKEESPKEIIFNIKNLLFQYKF